MQDLQTELRSAAAHHKAGRFDEAERHYRRILARAPDQADTLNLLATLKAQAGDPAEGCRLLRKAIAGRPGDPRFHLNLGKMLEMTGDLDAAEASYRASLDLDPDQVDSRIGLSRILHADGRLDEAIACYRAILRARPGDPAWLMALGAALASKRAWDDAEKTYRQAIAAQPGYGPVHFSLGNLLKLRGRIAEAREAYLEALRLSHDPALTQVHLGECCQHLGRFEDAVAHYKQALALNERLFSQILTKMTSVPAGRFSLRVADMKRDLATLLR